MEEFKASKKYKDELSIKAYTSYYYRDAHIIQQVFTAFPNKF